MRINLASGQRPFERPWVNIDIRAQGYEIDVEADIRKLDMLEDNTVDILVAQHVVEHFDMSEIGDISKEWNRVLKPGGKLAIFVPNNKELAKAYLEGRIDDYIFNVNMYGAYQGHPGDLHRWSYNPEYLVKQFGDIWTQNYPITHQTLQDPLLQGSDCSLDWWILSHMFIK